MTRFYTEIFHRNREKSPSRDSEMDNSDVWLPLTLLPEVWIFHMLILSFNLDHQRMLTLTFTDLVELPEPEEQEPVSPSTPRDRR